MDCYNGLAVTLIDRFGEQPALKSGHVKYKEKKLKKKSKKLNLRKKPVHTRFDDEGDDGPGTLVKESKVVNKVQNNILLKIRLTIIDKIHIII